MLNRFMTYFPCLLRLSFFARIQSRLPFGGLPRICLIFSLIKKILWKLWLRARSISQKSVDFLVSTIPCWILFIIGFRIMHFHMISIVYYLLLPSFYKRGFFFRANNYHNSTVTIKKFNTILYYLLLANGTCSGFPDSETPVPSPLGNCWTAPPANSTTNILNKVLTFSN